MSRILLTLEAMRAANTLQAADRFGVMGLMLLPVLMIIAIPVAPTGAIAGVAVYLSGLFLAVRGMTATYPHDRFGLCNLITTIRLLLTAVILALAVELLLGTREAGWVVFVLASLALALDGVDGYFARRHGLTSDFGARYDIEVDSALAAALAVVVLLIGRAGPEVLILGFLRYAFVLAAVWLPWLNAPLPESLRRKTICVIQIAALIALTAPVLPDWLARPFAGFATILLIWSFARDIRWLAARR